MKNQDSYFRNWLLDSVNKILIQYLTNFSQIKFVYDDETTWCYGWSDGGKEDNRPLILVKGTVYKLGQ